MDDLSHGPGPGIFSPARTGLLTPALRTDLADLNAEYLDLGLMPELEADSRFDWSGAVRDTLRAADVGTLARVAAAPFALFELLPVTAPRGVLQARVEDSRPAAPAAAWQGRCESFAHQALFLARRLLDGEPLAARVVLGLSDETVAWLAGSRVAQLAAAAGDPRLVRPRWRLHLRFWQMLVGAARRDSPAASQWAHCAGLCLIDAPDGAAAPPRRRPRR